MSPLAFRSFRPASSKKNILLQNYFCKFILSTTSATVALFTSWVLCLWRWHLHHTCAGLLAHVVGSTSVGASDTTVYSLLGLCIEHKHWLVLKGGIECLVGFVICVYLLFENSLIVQLWTTFNNLLWLYVLNRHWFIIYSIKFMKIVKNAHQNFLN